MAQPEPPDTSGHDGSVPYAVVTRPAPDTRTWRAQRSTDGVHLSSLCPRCHGPAYGPRHSHLPESLPGPASLLPPDSALERGDVQVECACGHPHGRSGGASCGWYADLHYDGNVITMADVSAADADAYRIIAERRVERLDATRQRAQRWIAGIGAVLALLTSALVFKPPDKLGDLTGGYRLIVVVLAVGALALLGAGVYLAYAAAYGRAGGTRVDRLLDDPSRQPGQAGSDLEQAVIDDVKTSRWNLHLAGILTVVGVVVLGIAVALAVALPAAPAKGGSATVCVKARSATLRLDGPPAVVANGTVEYVACPPS